MKNTYTVKVQKEIEIEVTFPMYLKSPHGVFCYAVMSESLSYTLLPRDGQIKKDSNSLDFILSNATPIEKSEYFKFLDLTIKNSEALFAELYNIIDVEEPTDSDDENVGFEYNPISEQMDSQ